MTKQQLIKSIRMMQLTFPELVKFKNSLESEDYFTLEFMFEHFSDLISKKHSIKEIRNKILLIKRR